MIVPDPTEFRRMPADRPFWTKPLTLALGLAVGVAAAVYPFVGEAYRPLNFAAFGAIGLFVGARAGVLPGLLLALGSKLAADLINYRQHGFDPEYVPAASIYLCFAAYPLLGRLLLRRTESPVWVGGAAVLAGLPFFLITNFLAWWGKVLPYPDTLAGLVECYTLAVPFHRATLYGDLAFSVTLFGLHSVLSRAFFPAERLAPAPTGVLS